MTITVVFFALVIINAAPVHHLPLVVLIAAFITALELSSAKFSTSMVSVTPALIFISSISFGFFQTSLSLLLSMFILFVPYKRSMLVVAFNTSQYGLSTMIGLWAYTRSGGVIGNHAANLMALVSYALVYSITNFAVTMFVLFLHSRSMWNEAFRGNGFFLTTYVVETSLGAAGAILFQSYGTVALVVVFVVLWIVLLAYKRSVDMMYVAETDDLTGLLNRKAFQQRITHMMRREDCASLLVIDLDHFKQVNDSSGHQNGDMVLQETAQIIREAVGASGIVARYGGEEFCVLLFTGDGALLAERLRTRIEQHQFDELAKLHLTVSIGVAVYPNDATEWSGLFECADRALYEAKRVRNVVAEYSPLLYTQPRSATTR